MHMKPEHEKNQRLQRAKLNKPPASLAFPHEFRPQNARHSHDHDNRSDGRDIRQYNQVAFIDFPDISMKNPYFSQ